MRDTLRAVGLVVAGVIVVVGLGSTAILYLSDTRLSQTIAVPRESLAIPTDISSMQRGQHLASAIALCLNCHGSNLAGKVVVDDPSIGRIVAANLTRGRGGIGTARSDVDLARAIRQGLDPSGRPLLMMPADNYYHFGDADLGAIVAYVRSIPAIDSALPASEIRSVGRVFFVLGQLPLLPATNIDRTAPRPLAPKLEVSADYGKYLSDVAGCASCHGLGYSGGKIPQAPSRTVAAANLTSTGLGQWSEADFVRVMRTGSRPDGRHLDTFMPWPYYAQMTDDELRAIWLFLRALPARPTGTR